MAVSVGFAFSERQMSRALDELDAKSAPEALTDFLGCCGVMRWAGEMAKARPFLSVDAVLSEASWRIGR